MLTEKEVRHIAELARIELTDTELEQFRKELSSVLDYIGKLNEVSTEGVTPLAQVTGLTNTLRDDEYREVFPMDEKLNEFLIGQAPHKKERFIKAQSVKKG